MATFEVFDYVETVPKIIPNDSLVAIIPSGIASSEALLQLLYEQLKLPSYFGFNWNALEECLKDFHWLKKVNVILIHEELPSFCTSDLTVYIEVLDSCVRHWLAGNDGRFTVIFPQSCRAKLEHLADYPS